MKVISESEARTTTTPAGVMKALVGPSQGSHQLSAWRVQMEPGSASPEHMIDRDQVWMPVSGMLEVTIADETCELIPGQAVVIPSDSVRQIRTTTSSGEALVCMTPGGQASVVGEEGKLPLPWAG